MFDINKTTTVETRHHAEIDRHKLIASLASAGSHCTRQRRLFVRVPGGGDYSNCTSTSTTLPAEAAVL